MLQSCQHRLRMSIILLLCLLNISFGYCGGNALPTGGGAVGICYVLLISSQLHDLSWRENRSSPPISQIAAPTVQPSVDGSNFDDPIEQMFGQSRYALLLRRQVVGSLSEENFHRAVDAFQRGMAFVPEGDVEVSAGMEFFGDDFSGDAADGSLVGSLLHVDPFFLDRWPVTNRQYYEFVAAGGYQEIVLWEGRIWTAVLDMVDQTGLPGPRFWKNGCYLSGEEELPVMGIGWPGALLSGNRRAILPSR
jgi:iron(II)-dependent oxidoreductase